MTYLPDGLYKTITGSMPIVCIDLVPVRQKDNQWQVGIMTRATGQEAGKPAILGGRIYHGETISTAIARHIKTDWNITKYQFYKTNDEPHPFYVQQYLHQDSAEPPMGYDPSKHAVSLVYLIQLGQEPQPQNEAIDFYWIRKDQVPKSSAYNHHVVMALTFEELQKN